MDEPQPTSWVALDVPVKVTITQVTALQLLLSAFDDVIVLSAFATERERIQAAGSITRNELLVVHREYPALHRLRRGENIAATGHELMESEGKHWCSRTGVSDAGPLKQPLADSPAAGSNVRTDKSRQLRRDALRTIYLSRFCSD